MLHVGFSLRPNIIKKQNKKEKKILSFRYYEAGFFRFKK